MSGARGPGILLDVYSALFPAGGIGRYVRDVARGLIDRPEAPPAAFVYPARLPTARMPDMRLRCSSRGSERPAARA